MKNNFTFYVIRAIIAAIVVLIFCIFKSNSLNPADFGYKTRIAGGIVWIVYIFLLDLRRIDFIGEEDGINC